VRVLADGHNLYFGITNVDPRPDAIAVHTLQRDHSLDDDDHITIVFDTFGANHLGYWFQVNAGGARADGLSVNNDDQEDWNGIWDASVQRTPGGWKAEIAISTRSLQFRPELEAWGLNIQRYVPRDQLSLRWAGVTLNSEFFDLRRTGELRGVTGLDQGLGLEVRPYGLAPDALFAVFSGEAAGSFWKARTCSNSVTCSISATTAI
jgi:hypothetical protein